MSNEKPNSKNQIPMSLWCFVFLVFRVMRRFDLARRRLDQTASFEEKDPR
jgi:hypothetical protein